MQPFVYRTSMRKDSHSGDFVLLSESSTAETLLIRDNPGLSPSIYTLPTVSSQHEIPDQNIGAEVVANYADYAEYASLTRAAGQRLGSKSVYNSTSAPIRHIPPVGVDFPTEVLIHRNNVHTPQVW